MQLSPLSGWGVGKPWSFLALGKLATPVAKIICRVRLIRLDKSSSWVRPERGKNMQQPAFPQKHAAASLPAKTCSSQPAWSPAAVLPGLTSSSFDREAKTIWTRTRIIMWCTAMIRRTVHWSSLGMVRAGRSQNGLRPESQLVSLSEDLESLNPRQRWCSSMRVCVQRGKWVE